MKKWCLTIVLFSFAMMSTVFAAGDMVIGDWAGERCSSYNDSTAYGTYNWNFTSDSTLYTYIQYHTGYPCNNPTFQSIQAQGTYQFENKNGIDTLVVKFNHLSESLVFNVTLEGDHLIMRNSQSGYSYKLKRKS